MARFPTWKYLNVARSKIRNDLVGHIQAGKDRQLGIYNAAVIILWPTFVHANKAGTSAVSNGLNQNPGL
jgi:hypothetical protein